MSNPRESLKLLPAVGRLLRIFKRDSFEWESQMFHHMVWRPMKFLSTLIFTLFAISADLRARQPDAESIIAGARIATTLTVIEEALQGTLSGNGKKVPISLFLRGKNIQFQFTENGVVRVFHMRLNNDAYDLFEMRGGKTINFPREKLIERIAGTDLTYEDLAFRFFYWPKPKLEGIEKVGGFDCYKIRLNKPSGAAGNYEAVYAWIHTKFGAFMRIRGHDARGNLVKEFQVEDVMKISDDVWTLRQMQVASYNPGTGRRSSITDMRMEKPGKVTLKGLR